MPGIVGTLAIAKVPDVVPSIQFVIGVTDPTALSVHVTCAWTSQQPRLRRGRCRCESPAVRARLPVHYEFDKEPHDHIIRRSRATDRTADGG